MAEITSFLSKQALKEAREYIDLLKTGSVELGKMATSFDKLSKATKKNTKSEKDLTAVEKESNKLLKQRETLIAKQDKSLNKLTLDVVKQKEALKEQNKQLREQARADLGLKKRSSLFQTMTKSMLASLTVIGAITGALKLVWKEISRTTEFQQKFEQGANAMRASLDVLHGAFKNINSGGFENFNKRLDEAIQKSIDLTKQMQRNRVEAVIYSKSLNRLLIREEILLSFANDATRSFQLREDAANRAFKIREKRLLEEAKLTKKALEDEKQAQKDQEERGVSITEEQIKRLAQLQIAFDNSLGARKKARQEYNKIIRDLRLDDFEQELDFIFDVADKRKTANEKEIADTQKTMSERQRILKETNKLLDESFKDQIDLFNSFHGLQIDTNKLLTLNNKESFEYARSLGMSERATNRLLEVIRERIAAVSDLSEAQKQLRKDDVIEPVKSIEFEKAATLDFKTEWEKRQEILKENLAKIEEFEQASYEIRTQNRDAFVEAIVESGNILFDLAQSQRDRELEGIRSNYDAKIQAAEGNGALQERLAQELAVKEAEIQRQQAVSERNQQLFNLAITTAQKGFQIKAQAAVLASNPVTAPLVPNAYAQLALLLGVSGLTAAAILSRPLPEIPAFFKGTSDAPSTFIAGERGAELIYKKDGSVELTPNKSTLYSGKEYEHASIIPNPETQRILAYNAQRNENNKIEKKLDKVVDAIQKNHSIVNIHRSVGHVNINYINRKYGKKL